MNALAMPAAALPALAEQPRRGSLRCTAAAVSLGLHLGLGTLLLAGWQASEPPLPQVATLSLQLLALAPPTPPAPLVEPPVAAPPLETAPPTPAEPRVEPSPPEQAALARRRVEEQRREREMQRQREERQRQEQERREAQQREQLERQRLAEQQRQQAAAEAAERARQAEAAAAASRQYLPIAKQAPAYPQRALEQGIQGECTVSYSVTPQGRVADPQVVGDCHPLFIRPSLNAARAFRYQPRVIDGRAVAVPNVKNTFTYRIEQR